MSIITLIPVRFSVANVNSPMTSDVVLFCVVYFEFCTIFRFWHKVNLDIVQAGLAMSHFSSTKCVVIRSMLYIDVVLWLPDIAMLFDLLPYKYLSESSGCFILVGIANNIRP